MLRWYYEESNLEPRLAHGKYSVHIFQENTHIFIKVFTLISVHKYPCWYESKHTFSFYTSCACFVKDAVWPGTSWSSDQSDEPFTDWTILAWKLVVLWPLSTTGLGAVNNFTLQLQTCYKDFEQVRNCGTKIQIFVFQSQKYILTKQGKHHQNKNTKINFWNQCNQRK
jgi:hypothetical protein